MISSTKLWWSTSAITCAPKGGGKCLLHTAWIHYLLTLSVIVPVFILGRLVHPQTFQLTKCSTIYLLCMRPFVSAIIVLKHCAALLNLNGNLPPHPRLIKKQNVYCCLREICTFLYYSTLKIDNLIDSKKCSGFIFTNVNHSEFSGN